MDFNNNSFIISDSFYEVEYETHRNNIFDIYQIGSWNIEVVKKYEQITIIELLVYFNELLKACPWLYVKRERISKEPTNNTFFDSKQSYIDFNINVLRSTNGNDITEWYLGFFECGFYVQYQGNEIDMNHKEQIIVSPFFDVEYKTLSFNLEFKMDVFFANPSRQPNVVLPSKYVKLNRDKLSASLKAIETSGIFTIKNFESEFYPNAITKYGFQDLF